MDLKKRYMKKRDSIIQTNSIVIEDDIFVEYNIIYDERDYNVMFVSDRNEYLYNDVVEFRKTPKLFLDKRNNIVFCGLTDKTGDILFDATDDVRMFCFYFGKQKNLLVFFKYLQNKLCKKINNNINVYNHDLTIYMNDDCFSEKVFTVNEILYNNFSSIFDNVNGDGNNNLTNDDSIVTN